MKKEVKEVLRTFLCEVAGGLIIIFAMLALVLLFDSCAHKTFEEVEKVHDTLRVYQYHRDSVIHRDSVFLHVYERGDTVYSITERWNVQYMDRVRVDTVYQVKEAQAQSKEVVEKKEPWYVRAFPWLLVGVLGTISLLLITRKKA